MRTGRVLPALSVLRASDDVSLRQADGNRPGEPGYDPRTLYIPKSAWATFTPFERQFWEIKQNHYDTVLFFQKGKFFELYEEDAVRLVPPLYPACFREPRR